VRTGERGKKGGREKEREFPIGGEKEGESQRGERGRREEGGERGGGLERVKGGRRRAGRGGPSKGRDSNSDFFCRSRMSGLSPLLHQD